MNKPEKGFSRRQMLEMAIGLGGFTLTGGLGSISAQEIKRILTPEQIMGPFYPLVRPLDQDADLTVIKGRRGQAEGKVIHLSGRVLNRNGEPVRGAKIELWQANANGRYAHATDTNRSPLDPNFQGYGVQFTDAKGQYRFKTIKPGAYPISPVVMRPPHIHFDIAGKNDRLITQMYFPDDPLNEKDSIFNELGSHKDAAIGKILPSTKELGTDSLVLTWDIVLERG
jgi:protocatechuate 3,4-dioxygenase beta subunit